LLAVGDLERCIHVDSASQSDASCIEKISRYKLEDGAGLAFPRRSMLKAYSTAASSGIRLSWCRSSLIARKHHFYVNFARATLSESASSPAAIEDTNALPSSNLASLPQLQQQIGELSQDRTVQQQHVISGSLQQSPFQHLRIAGLISPTFDICNQWPKWSRQGCCNQAIAANTSRTAFCCHCNVQASSGDMSS